MIRLKKYNMYIFYSKITGWCNECVECIVLIWLFLKAVVVDENYTKRKSNLQKKNIAAKGHFYCFRRSSVDDIGTIIGRSMR